MNATGGARAIGLVAAIVASIGLLVGASAGTADAAPAQAASSGDSPVQFSDDGIHWSNSYTGALFDGALIVPGGSIDRSFSLRNGADEPAILLVTLYGVAATDLELADAMTLSSSAPGLPGASVPVTAARPCATLSHGQVLAAGGSVRLDNVAALADLTGTGGQAGQVSFNLAISLSSTDSAAPAPDSCPTDFGNTVVGSPDPGAGTASHPVYHLGAGGWTPVPATASAPAPAPSGAPTAPTVPDGHGPGIGALVGNTERFYQENTVALWLAMAALGGSLFFVVRRRRRLADPALEYPNIHDKIGMGR